MKKAIVGMILGGVVFFVWGMVSWMVIGWYEPTLKRLPEETLIRDTMRIVVKEPGLYMMPSSKPVEGATGMIKDEFSKSYEMGPNAVIAFHPGGRPAMSGKNFAVGLAVGFIISAVAMLVLLAGRSRLTSFALRVGMVTALGVMVWTASNVSYWNWMLFPADYTLVALLDAVCGYTLVGAVLAKFVPQA